MTGGEQEKRLTKLRELCQELHGPQLFNKVTSFISSEFDLDYVLIGVLLGSRNDKIKTISVSMDHNIVDNLEYELNGTPCDNVLFKNACYYASNVQALFPTDFILQDLKVETYLGFPLYGKHLNPIGIIVCMDREKIDYTDDLLTALRTSIPYLEQEIELYSSNPAAIPV